MSEFKYKFKEDEIFKQLEDYVKTTYGKHYASGDVNSPQAFEFISQNAIEGFYFSTGNIKKYGLRLGKKDEVENELLKIAHYAILALYCSKKMKEKDETK